MSARTKDWITIAVPTLLALGALFLVLNLTSTLPGQVGSYRVKVLAPEVSSLTKAANVMIAGLPAGRVMSVERRGSNAVVELALDDDHAPIPRDSRFAVRLRTLVGENYVEVYPGRSRSMVPDGGVLPRSQSIEYVEADEILDTLQGGTRERARQLIQGLGEGVRDRGGQLNRLVGGTAGVIEGAAPVMRVLNEDRRELARVIDDLGEISRAVGERGTALRALATNARVTFRSIAERDESVRAFLEEMPPLLRQVRGTTASVRLVTRQATPVLFDLATAIREARPAVNLLEPAAEEGRAVVSELGRAAPALQGTLQQLRELAPPTVRALPAVRRVFCQVNPMAEHLRPYAQDIATFVNNVGAVTNYYDATGHAARLYFTTGPKGSEGYDEQTAKAVSTLVSTGFLGTQVGMGYNAYPAPGRNDDLTTGRGVFGPEGTQTRYERVHAEC